MTGLAFALKIGRVEAEFNPIRVCTVSPRSRAASGPWDNGPDAHQRKTHPVRLRLVDRGLFLHAANPRYILNRMVQFSRARLDASFAALSDATRRGVLEQLGRAEASITELAETFHMTLTGMKKHVSVLEQAGLVTTKKVGRVRTCKLGLRRLEEETAWIERYRQLWASRFDELDKVIEEQKQKEMVDGRKKRE